MPRPEFTLAQGRKAVKKACEKTEEKLKRYLKNGRHAGKEWCHHNFLANCLRKTLRKPDLVFVDDQCFKRCRSCDECEPENAAYENHRLTSGMDIVVWPHRDACCVWKSTEIYEMNNQERRQAMTDNLDAIVNWPRIVIEVKSNYPGHGFGRIAWINDLQRLAKLKRCAENNNKHLLCYGVLVDIRMREQDNEFQARVFQREITMEDSENNDNDHWASLIPVRG